MNDTYFAKSEDVKKNWYVVNADGQILGRLAARIAVILRGKDKPTFTPHVDTGDFVVVVNAEKIKLTGKKLSQKNYARHSGYPGGLRVFNAKTMLERKPEDVIKIAVRGMLPKNILGRKLIKKLKVYRGSGHPHMAQMPKEINL
ncbi:MAG: 50S ribosomal protein L13 [Syntrophorhabdaceae bacterium]|nr:50S ribosomal protein L13 [Syntrophorhabdales bacterium]MBP9560722.1 50S ribosomal protein L13 [Syntrophorhabdaceae bacterium]